MAGFVPVIVPLPVLTLSRLTVKSSFPSITASSVVFTVMSAVWFPEVMVTLPPVASV